MLLDLLPDDGDKPAHGRIQVHDLDLGLTITALRPEQHLAYQLDSLQSSPFRTRELPVPLFVERLAAELLQAARHHQHQVRQLVGQVRRFVGGIGTGAARRTRVLPEAGLNNGRVRSVEAGCHLPGTRPFDQRNLLLSIKDNSGCRIVVRPRRATSRDAWQPGAARAFVSTVAEWVACSRGWPEQCASCWSRTSG